VFPYLRTDSQTDGRTDESIWGGLIPYLLRFLQAKFWHHTNYHPILVTYPPHAVTSPSLMNLGPVARLDPPNFIAGRLYVGTIILIYLEEP